MEFMVSHIGIYTIDLERSRAFYERYFGAKSGSKYANDKGFSSYFLTLSSGARLELMAHEKLSLVKAKRLENGIAHIAFSVGSRENVRALTERLSTDGYEVLSPVRETGDGYYESCIADPDGNAIELTV